jgi:hypothetical protein
MQAVVERPDLYEITINGNIIKPSPGKWWLDREAGVLPIGKYVKQGTNVLTLKLSPMKIMAEIEPVYIRGVFDVAPVAKGWEIRQPSGIFAKGSWKEQGRPFYSGAAVYTKKYNIEDADGRYILQAEEWKGTLAVAFVNGKEAGIIAFEPYTLDVSGLLKNGVNEVGLKVIGSNKNLLGPFHNNPSPGLTSPWHFRNVRTYPSGSDYKQLDYGLMEDFILKKAE